MDNGTTRVTDRRADGLDEELGRAARKGMPMPPSIAKGLVKAMAAAKAVAKGAENKHHGYAYASAESVITEAREALAAGGISLLTESWDVVTREVRYPSTDADGVVTMTAEDEDHVVVYYLLVSAEGDSWRPDRPVRTPILPEKGRPPDKALATALTYNLSYYLRALLLLARVAKDEEVDTRDDTAHQPKPRQRPAAKGKPQPPPAEPGQPATPGDFVLRYTKLAGTKFRDLKDESLAWVRDDCQKHVDAKPADTKGQQAVRAVYGPHLEAALAHLAEREAARAAQPPAAAPTAPEPAPHPADQGLEQGGCSAQDGDVP